MTKTVKNIGISLVTLMLLAACGNKQNNASVEDLINGGNLEAIKAKRQSIYSEQKELNAQLTQLDAAIKQLDKTNNATLITIQTVKDTVFDHFIEIQGNVETDQNVIVYPEFQGILTQVFVKQGQRVAKGQLLGQIDDGGLSSQLSQLEVQTQLAKTTYERQERLWKQNIGSEIQYLQAKANYEASQSAVNQLKKQLAKTRIVAPYTGIVDQVITDQGTVVAPGMGVFRVVNLGDMYISAEVPERFLNTVTEGKDVEIFFPVLGKSVRSKVRQTGNYINPNNRSFKIEVSVPAMDNVKPNLTAKLKINDYSNQEAKLIPLSVISEDASGQQYVYKMIADSTGTFVAKRSDITTGLAQNDVIEILEGLETNDAVIVEGARSVQQNQEVRTLDNQ